jgi:hypothetical protein
MAFTTISMTPNAIAFSKKQLAIIDELSQIALKSDMRSLHGAMLIKNGKVLSKGFNSNRNCINGGFTNTTHAEISVLYQALKGCPLARQRKLCD